MGDEPKFGDHKYLLSDNETGQESEVDEKIANFLMGLHETITLLMDDLVRNRCLGEFQRREILEKVSKDIEQSQKTKIKSEGKKGTYCAFCNAEYPEESEDVVDAIQKHVRVCPFHPIQEYKKACTDMELRLVALTAKLALAEKSLNEISGLCHMTCNRRFENWEHGVQKINQVVDDAIKEMR